MSKFNWTPLLLLLANSAHADSSNCSSISSLLGQQNSTAIKSILQAASSGCDACKTQFFNNYDQLDYNFGVCENGKFKIEMNTFFPEATSAENVFNQYFLQGSKLKATSDLIVSSSSPGTVEALAKKDKYTVNTVVNKSVLGVSNTSTITSNCSMSKAETVKQKCTIDLTKNGAAEYFSGDNSTTIECTKKASATKGVTCAITVVGKTKKYWRSAKRLAISGAIETMRNMFGLSFIAHPGCNTMSCAAESRYFKNNIEPFWERGVDAAEKSVIPDNKILFASSGDKASSKVSSDDSLLSFNKSDQKSSFLQCK